jgi:hypothetical protein
MPGRLDPKSTGQTRHCQSQFAAQLKVPSRPVAMLASPGREVDIWFCGTLQTSPLQQPGLEEMMSPCARTFASAAALVVFSAVAVAQTTLDPAFVGFKLPDQIAWKDNQSGSRTAPQGDPSKTGPYHRPAAMAAGKDEPAAVHPNDRFFIVVSGTWWVGSGPEFKPDAPPMAAGSHVIHYAKGVHFDGAKDEQATILVWGEGSATTAPFGTSPVK